MCLKISMKPDEMRYIDALMDKHTVGSTYMAANYHVTEIIRNKMSMLATTDVVAYKNLVMKESMGSFLPWPLKRTIAYSPYQNFKYKIGKVYKQHLDIQLRGSGNIEVNMGLHAWQTIRDANNMSDAAKLTLFEVVLPKGSRYFIGKNGDIVSDTMIIKRKSKIK